MKSSKTGNRFDFREWIELLIAGVALSVSVISVWVAIGTERANRQMVAAASWPLLQADTSDVPEAGRSMITFTLMNGGVGPAKLKTLEISWRGKAFTGAVPLLEACCGYKPFSGPADLLTAERTPITTGGVRNVVVLAGEKRSFLRMPLGSDNVLVWRKLDKVRRELRFRACYCSVFDECWTSKLVEDIEPKRVQACPAVSVQYVE